MDNKMSTKTYYYKITDSTGGPRVAQNIQVGTKTIHFVFQWAVASEEQFNIIARYLTGKASNDPLYDGEQYIREYDWYSYYISLVGKDLDKWLDAQKVLPVSLLNKSRDQQKYLLGIYIKEAIALHPAIQLYTEVLRWSFTATLDSEATVGYIIPGGWYRNQDNTYAFRFMSGQEVIGRNDINNVYIVFEVYDE